MNHISKITLAIFGILMPMMANAYKIEYGRSTLNLTGYATGGFIEPDFETPNFIGDWRARGELSFDATDTHRVGAVYAIDASAVDEERYIREAFTYYQNKNYGRIEVGFTDSIARKLGVGLPDVGSLRVNDKPLFYKKITPLGAVIADTTITTGRTALRTNIVSMPTSGIQYGISVAGLTDDYNAAYEFGLKLRNPSGKIKSAWSFGASFMDKPNGYRSDSFTPRVYADWRAQGSLGLNVQYNSWIFGTTARVIYDRNPIGETSDGMAIGTGISYDLLKSSVSLTYILSDTDVWAHDVAGYVDNTVVGSFRYKYSENVGMWMSIGTTSKTPFLSVGMKLTF